MQRADLRRNSLDGCAIPAKRRVNAAWQSSLLRGLTSRGCPGAVSPACERSFVAGCSTAKHPAYYGELVVSCPRLSLPTLRPPLRLLESSDCRGLKLRERLWELASGLQQPLQERAVQDCDLQRLSAQQFPDQPFKVGIPAPASSEDDHAGSRNLSTAYRAQ